MEYRTSYTVYLKGGQTIAKKTAFQRLTDEELAKNEAELEQFRLFVTDDIFGKADELNNGNLRFDTLVVNVLDVAAVDMFIEERTITDI